MPYLARCAVILKCDIKDFKKNKWCNFSKDPKYKMRLRDDLCLEVICGCFANKSEALNCAKKMFVSLIYHLLKNNYTIKDGECCCGYNYCNVNAWGTLGEFDEEELFNYSPDSKYQYTGLGVFEVPNSTDDFDALYSFSPISWTEDDDKYLLDKFNPKEYVFSYNSEVETLLYDLIEADRVSSMGLKMTKYCGLLEHIAGMCIKQKTKDDDIIAVIDKLIDQTNRSDLDEKKTVQLVTYLENGKNVSSRRRCREVINKYANKKYGGYKADDVFNEAYGIRSTYSHGVNTPLYSKRYDKAEQIKFILLDVIKGYMLEKENGECQNNQQP